METFGNESPNRIFFARFWAEKAFTAQTKRKFGSFTPTTMFAFQAVYACLFQAISLKLEFITVNGTRYRCIYQRVK